MSDRQAAGQADGLVMFGLTGDLAEKELFPALVQLAQADALPEAVVGVGRSELTDGELADRLIDATGDAGRAALDRFDLRYVAGDTASSATFDEIMSRSGGVERPVVYAALPPSVFGELAEGLAETAWRDRCRLVIEKPFGTDATSARELHDRLAQLLAADRLFLVDHFLGYAAIEGVGVARRANRLLDAACRAPHVRRIEVTLVEDFGVEGRGGFYDEVGVVADVVQSHVLQLAAAAIMDDPGTDDADAITRARRAAFDAIEPLTADRAAFGQYRGYLDHDGVEDDSTTSTFVAATTSLRGSRWEGTELAVRSGKRLGTTRTLVDYVFDPIGGGPPGRLRFDVVPAASLSLRLGLLDPSDHGVRPTSISAAVPSRHDGLDAYATMLRSAMTGDRRHFATLADVVAGWELVAGLVEADPDPEPYDTGSMGPQSVDDLVDGGWSRLDDG